MASGDRARHCARACAHLPPHLPWLAGGVGWGAAPDSPCAGQRRNTWGRGWVGRGQGCAGHCLVTCVWRRWWRWCVGAAAGATTRMPLLAWVWLLPAGEWAPRIRNAYTRPACQSNGGGGVRCRVSDGVRGGSCGEGVRRGSVIWMRQAGLQFSGSAA